MKALPVMPWGHYAALNHGKVLAADEHDAFSKNEQLLFDSTERIAATLEAAGVRCERTECLPLSLVNIITGEITQLKMWRNIGILPAIMVVKRRRDALELEAFCSQLNPKRLRMRVVTCGPRCTVDKVGESIGFLLNGFRRLPSRKWFSDVAELVSVGVEFPVVRRKSKRAVRDCQGRLLYHVHGHPIIYLKRWLTDAEWVDFNAKWHEHFGSYCPDSGVIRDVRESCKYPLKGADLETVRKSGELVELFRQLKRRHLFQPYNNFRLFRRQLRAIGQKVKRLHRPGAKAQLVLVDKQPSERVHYHRAKPSKSVPVDIFLGRRLPRASVTSPTMAVCELWMNLKSTPAEARRKRRVKVWTKPTKQPTKTAPEGAGPGQVHTVTLNARADSKAPASIQDQVIYVLKAAFSVKK